MPSDAWAPIVFDQLDFVPYLPGQFESPEPGQIYRWKVDALKLGNLVGALDSQPGELRDVDETAYRHVVVCGHSVRSFDAAAEAHWQHVVAGNSRLRVSR